MPNPFETAKVQLQEAARIASLDVNYIERLKIPDRHVEVSIPVIMDDGTQTIFTGFRSQHNNARGPYKGGIRYHQQVNLDEVRALSFWMSSRLPGMNLTWNISLSMRFFDSFTFLCTSGVRDTPFSLEISCTVSSPSIPSLL